ncbi:FAD-binding oxidoreductase, partial [Thioclava sp. BHET1]
VEAPALLVATNAYHQLALGAYAPQYIAVSYCQFATAPLSDAARAEVMPGGEGCWDTATVMTSIRTDAAGRLIVGGIGNAEGPGAAIHANWARRKLRRLYPQLGDLPFEHAWRGRIAMTGDHIPKAVEFGPNAYAVFGYSGRGICPGTVIGAAAGKALLG